MPPATGELPDFDSLWDFYQPAESERRFQALLPQTEALPAYRAELLTQIARAQGLQRKFDQAHDTLDQAEALLAAGMDRGRVRYLLERGRVHNSSRNREAARPIFQQAWELAQASQEDALAVDAAHMLAIVSPAGEQLDWNLKAVSIAEASQDARARRWLGSLYNNIGWTYHDQGQYERALEHFLKALEARQAQEDPREVRVARWCVGRVLRSLDRIDEALEVQEALLAEYESLGEKDGFVYEEMGECLLRMGRVQEARAHFKMAYQELSQDPWLAENEPERLARLKELGR